MSSGDEVGKGVETPPESRMWGGDSCHFAVSAEEENAVQRSWEGPSRKYKGPEVGVNLAFRGAAGMSEWLELREWG